MSPNGRRIDTTCGDGRFYPRSFTGEKQKTITLVYTVSRESEHLTFRFQRVGFGDAIVFDLSGLIVTRKCVSTATGRQRVFWKACLATRVRLVDTSVLFALIMRESRTAGDLRRQKGNTVDKARTSLRIDCRNRV